MRSRVRGRLVRVRRRPYRVSFEPQGIWNFLQQL
jgi:hypothetical protein